MAGRPKKGEPTLTLDRIIEVAWRLVDREGIDALSTRNLAAALDVKSPALYWHFDNKTQLLNLMMERLVGGSFAAARPDAPWWEWMLDVGHEQRRILLAHRDSGFLAARAMPGAEMRDVVFGGAVARLVEAGFTRDHAAKAFGGLARIVLGSVIYEQNPHTRAFVEAYGDLDEAFAFALGTYVAGLRGEGPDQSS